LQLVTCILYLISFSFYYVDFSDLLSLLVLLIKNPKSPPKRVLVCQLDVIGQVPDLQPINRQ
jgi:hypothetical protein